MGQTDRKRNIKIMETYKNKKTNKTRLINTVISTILFQDLGNLNLTFFTHRSLYNRPENLALIVKVLRERWRLDVKVSPRDDILLENRFKISFDKLVKQV